MLDDLVIQAEDSTPIFQQLENQLLRFIRAGRVLPGEELPSVRAMATHLAVNPMTVSKTINRLVDKGWLERRRGRPTCVATHLPDAATASIDQQLHAEIERLISHSRQLDLRQEQLIEHIRTTWSKEGNA